MKKEPRKLACRSNLPERVSWSRALEGGGDIAELWGPALKDMLQAGYKEIRGRVSGQQLQKKLNKLGDNVARFARFLYRCHALMAAETGGCLSKMQGKRGEHSAFFHRVVWREFAG